jgi:ABC-type transport system involved in cytochrome c biogenesis permease component
MFERLLDKIGDWNPQLMRELKSRLNLPNLAIATVISLLFQAITWLLSNLVSTQHSSWWWEQVHAVLNGEIWLVLAIGGIYTLAKDFDREIQQGTLSIVKLAPINSTKFLIGKLLGVPILIYWVVFLALPFHLLTIERIASTFPQVWLWDLVGVSVIGLLYANAILSIVNFSLQPILLSAILSAIGWLGLSIVNSSLPIKRMHDVYFNFEQYESQVWWHLSLTSISFAIVGWILLIFIQSWYFSSKSRNASDRYWTSFLTHQGLLTLWIVLAGLHLIEAIVAIGFIIGLGILVAPKQPK